jgi:hypothetical protein
MSIKMEFVYPDGRTLRFQCDSLKELIYQQWFWEGFLACEMPETYVEEAVKMGFILPKEEPPIPEETYPDPYGTPEANRMDAGEFISPTDYEQPMPPQRPPQQPQRQTMQPPRNQSLENERERLRRLYEQRRRAEAAQAQRR